MSLGRILIVDDEPKLIHLVREILMATGYEVLASSSGNPTLEMIAMEQPDLVILDIMLPGMDGYEICYRLRSEPATKKLPILMFSAKAQEIDKETGIKVGADDYLTKPSPPSEIVNRVAKLLAAKKGTATQEKVNG